MKAALFGTVALGAMLIAQPHAAHAQCVNVGGAVTCEADDTDGFFAPAGVDSITVGAGVTVDDSDNGGNGAVGSTGRGVIEVVGGVAGDIINNGTVTGTSATVNPGGGANSTFDIDGVISGQFHNTGTIIGIDSVDTDDINGGFINDGTITGIDALGSIAETVDVGDVSGGFVNNGLITSSTAGSIAEAIDVDDVVSGGFINNGTITATAFDSIADGVEADNITGDFVNTGTFTATTTTGDIADAVETRNISGNFTNSGTITSTAATDTADAVETDDIGGNFTNNGVISATAGGTTAVAVEAENITGSFTNNGTIMASDTGGAADAVIAISIGGLLSNTGTIASTTNAINVTGAAATAVNNSGVVTGSVLLGGGLNTFNNMAGGLFNAGPVIDLGAGNLLTNDGTLAPGGVGSIQTTALTGDLALNAGGTLAVDVSSPGAPGVSDFLDVSGTTTLGGTLSVNSLTPAATTVADTFEIIDSAGGVAGGFDAIVDNLPGLAFESSINGNIVELSIVADPTDVSTQEIFPSATQGSTQTSRLVLDTLQQRSRFGAPAGAQVAALNVNPTSFGGIEPAADLAPPVERGGWTAWIAGLAGFSDTDATPSLTGFDTTAGGLLLGIDRSGILSGGLTWQLGLAGGYTVTNIDSGLSDADVETGHIGGYGKLEAGPWLFSGAWAYGFQDYDFTRVVVPGLTTASGDADGDVLSLSGAISYDIAPILGIDNGGRLRVAPVVRADYVNASRDGFTETGAGILNLTVAADEFDRGWFSAGIEIIGDYVLEGGLSVQPQLDLRYERVLGSLANTNTTALLGVAGASFTALSAADDRNQFSAGLGARIEITDRLLANFRYDGSFSSDFESHRGSAGLTYNF